MRRAFKARLAVIFGIAFCLTALPGPFQAPYMSLAHGNVPPCETHGYSGACSAFWYPAGPSMDTFQATIFPVGADAHSEYSDIQSQSPIIDLPDLPLTPDLVPTFATNSKFLITDTVSQAGYFEIQFNLANNFWGVNFQFGNNPNGIQIRQGIAHLIDKARYVATEPGIAGAAFPVDDSKPTNNLGSLPSPNTCAWDSANVEAGSNCVVGAPGGVSYHLAAATGGNGIPWIPSPASLDLCAAANHFISAGIATGHDANCVLTGIASGASSQPPTFFVRNDNPTLLHLGDGLAQEICYMFTGAYTIPCTYLNLSHSPSVDFSGRNTSKTNLNLGWWMNTAEVSSPDAFAFDQGLYFSFNSRFVSGIPSIQSPSGPCSSESLPSFGASNYLYACNSSYDTVSSQMEFAPCLSSPGDPVVGQTNPTFANCPGTTSLSAISAGYQANDFAGKNVFTLPIFEQNGQYGYLNNGWAHIINDAGSGIPNYFTWLNAWNQNPPQPGMIRQGFSQSPNSLNPYGAETPWDFRMLRNIYDSLDMPNPLYPGQLLNWMTIREEQLSNSSLTYTPPAGTTMTYRLTLINSIYFHDGSRVTPFDIAFSYLSLKGSGAFQGSGAAPMTGITMLGPTQLDINMKGVGAFTALSLKRLTIVPARYWTAAGQTAWDNGINRCLAAGSVPCFFSQYTLGSDGKTPTCVMICGFPASNMNWDTAKTNPTYDPLANKILIGSGPWECGTPPNVGTGCSTSGTQMPGANGSYTLQRFGKGLAPASSLIGIYFRANGNLALWIWTTDNGNVQHDFFLLIDFLPCFGLPVTGTTAGCGHWQQGIGAGTGGPVGTVQIIIVVNRFNSFAWTSPFDYFSSPPLGIGPPPPVLHEGGATLLPAFAAGCTSQYPIGGYDC